MANVLEASLLDLTTLSADTSGDSVDIGLLRRAAHVEHRVESVSGTVKLFLETSADDTAWRTVDSRAAKVGSTVFPVFSLSRYIRLRATVSGGSSVQMQASAEAHVLYCDPEALQRYGLPSEAIAELTEEEKLDACLTATDEADSYIGAAYALPLLAWGKDIEHKTARIAVVNALDFRGWDPEAGGSIEKAHERALSWLNKVARGGVKPTGIQDSTATVVDSGSYVLSGTKREAFSF